jgi:hypothetical protein
VIDSFSDKELEELDDWFWDKKYQRFFLQKKMQLCTLKSNNFDFLGLETRRATARIENPSYLKGYLNF